MRVTNKVEIQLPENAKTSNFYIDTKGDSLELHLVREDGKDTIYSKIQKSSHMAMILEVRE